MRKPTNQELDQISQIAADAVEEYIFSRISGKEIHDIDINIELKYNHVLDVDIMLELYIDQLSNSSEDIVEKAVDSAMEAVDRYIENLK